MVNNGNLALKYKLVITGIKGSAKLNNGPSTGPSAVWRWALSSIWRPVTVDAEFTIKGHMQESAGNDYMNKSIDGIAITVVAAQDTVESDSFRCWLPTAALQNSR